MLSATKHLDPASEILRFAQDDKRRESQGDIDGKLSLIRFKADESAVCAINRHLRVRQASIGVFSRASARDAPTSLPVRSSLTEYYGCPGSRVK